MIDYSVELKKFWDPWQPIIRVFTEEEQLLLNSFSFNLDVSDNDEIGEALWEGEVYLRELQDPTQKWVALFEWAKCPDPNDDPLEIIGVDYIGIPWKYTFSNHVSRDGRKLVPWGSPEIHPLFRYGDFDWNQYQEASWILQWEPVFKEYEKLLNPDYLPELEPWIEANEERGDLDYLYIKPAIHEAMAQTDRYIRRGFAKSKKRILNFYPCFAPIYEFKFEFESVIFSNNIEFFVQYPIIPVSNIYFSNISKLDLCGFTKKYWLILIHRKVLQFILYLCVLF